MEKRLEIHYSGMVQGVGFRYTVLRISEMCPNVSGFVRNLSNSKVQVVLEGEEEVLKDFLDRIQRSFLKSYISGRELHWDNPKHEYNNFQIAF